MGEIINFQERAQALNTSSDNEDEYLIDAPAASDPFPDFKIFNVSHGRALMEAHVPTAIAEAMIEVVKTSPKPCSLTIYKRDEGTAWIDGCVPLVVVEALLEILAPCWGSNVAAA